MFWPHFFFVILLLVACYFALLFCFIVVPYYFTLFLHFVVLLWCHILLYHLTITPCYFTLLPHLVTSFCYFTLLLHLVMLPCYFTLLFCLVASPCQFVLLHHFATSLYGFALLHCLCYCCFVSFCWIPLLHRLGILKYIFGPCYSTLLIASLYLFHILVLLNQCSLLENMKETSLLHIVVNYFYTSLLRAQNQSISIVVKLDTKGNFLCYP
jgi:hypothetical protein